MQARLLRQAGQPSNEQTDFQGIPVVVEYRKGSTREGTAPDGTRWHRTMHADYGFVPDTAARGDGECLDVYIGPNPDATHAYLLEQLKEDGSYDEPKMMLGSGSLDEARTLYLQHYPDGWEDRIGDITPISIKRLLRLVGLEQERRA